jgi:hypothetical protein
VFTWPDVQSQVLVRGWTDGAGHVDGHMGDVLSFAISRAGRCNCCRVGMVLALLRRDAMDENPCD